MHPNFRNKGVAKTLSELVINDAKQKGIKIVIIRTYKNNLPSIQLAKKLGFNKIKKDLIEYYHLSNLNKKNLIVYYKKI